MCRHLTLTVSNHFRNILGLLAYSLVAPHGNKLKLVTENTLWPTGRPKIASVNSTGMAGANAHVVLQDVHEFLGSWGICNGICTEVPNGRSTELSRRTRFLLPVSAHDEPSLKANVAALEAILQGLDLWDLAYTLSSRRTTFAHRAYVTAEAGQSCEAVRSFTFGSKAPNSGPTLGFVFTGKEEG